MASHIVSHSNNTFKQPARTVALRERTRTFRLFMAGCNPMLLRQIGAGHVEIRPGSDGHVRLVEGSQL